MHYIGIQSWPCILSRKEEKKNEKREAKAEMNAREKGGSRPYCIVCFFSLHVAGRRRREKKRKGKARVWAWAWAWTWAWQKMRRNRKGCSIFYLFLFRVSMSPFLQRTKWPVAHGPCLCQRYPPLSVLSFFFFLSTRTYRTRKGMKLAIIQPISQPCSSPWLSSRFSRLFVVVCFVLFKCP